MSRSEFPQDLHHVSSLLIRTSALIPSGCPCGASCTWRNLESGKQITSEHPNCVSSVSALPSPLVAQRSEVVGGRKLRQSWLPSGVRALSVEFEGGSFFTGTCEWTRTGTCQERGGVGKASIAPCAQIRRQRGGMGGVGGDRKASVSPQVTCIICGSQSSVTGWEGRNHGVIALKTVMVEVCQCSSLI